MTWVAVAIGGSAVIGAGASYLGSKKQSEGAKDAAGLNMQMFNTLNRQQQPFIGGGYGAMGRLNTLLGLNPNPSYRPAMPDNSGYRITPGGGIDQTLQLGPPRQHDVFAGGPGGDPRTGDPRTARLSQLLALRAANGDRQAQAMLTGGV